MDNHDSASAKKDVSSSNKNASKKDTILLYLHDFVMWLVVILLVFLLLFRVVVVSGPSMNATLVHGDYLLLINNVFYAEPKQGDIVVVSKDSYDDGTPLVKRVIATENQKVDIDFEHGIVYVDGQALDEPYIYSPTTLKEGVQFPLVVEEGCIFVLGDNRMDSKDSRSPEIGLIDTREVLGKAIFLFMPGSNKGTEKPEFGRIGVIA